MRPVELSKLNAKIMVNFGNCDEDEVEVVVPKISSLSCGKLTFDSPCSQKQLESIKTVSIFFKFLGNWREYLVAVDNQKECDGQIVPFIVKRDEFKSFKNDFLMAINR